MWGKNGYQREDILALSLVWDQVKNLKDSFGNGKFSDFRVSESSRFKVRDGSYELKTGTLIHPELDLN